MTQPPQPPEQQPPARPAAPWDPPGGFPQGPPGPPPGAPGNFPPGGPPHGAPGNFPPGAPGGPPPVAPDGQQGAGPGWAPAVPVPQPGQPESAMPLGQSPYGRRPAPAPQPTGQNQFGQFTFPAMQKAKLEPRAVAGLATAIFGVPAIILGFMARPRVRGGRRRSPALAWSSIGLGAFFTAAWLLLAITLTLNGTVDRLTERPVAGDVDQTRTVAAANLAEGNCLAHLPPAQEVGEVRLVPCAEPHIAQVLARHTLDGHYPGQGELGANAQARCAEEVEALGQTEEALTPWHLVPSEVGWEQGNTQIICLARGATGPFEGDLLS